MKLAFHLKSKINSLRKLDISEMNQIKFLAKTSYQFKANNSGRNTRNSVRKMMMVK